MLFLSILIILSIGSIYWYSKDEWNGFALTLSFVFSTATIIALILLPILYYDGKAEIKRYYALKQTIEDSRKNELSDIERAALTKKIVEYNADLASVKYWNDTIFDIYIPDELAKLDYLK
jgi:amino acid transporter